MRSHNFLLISRFSNSIINSFGGDTMKMDYSRLWKLLIDKKLKKKDLAVLTNLSPSTISKLSAGSNVNTDVLLKICGALNCGLDDIVEITDTEK